MDNNIFNLSDVDFNALKSEHFIDLLSYNNVKIERIVSSGHASDDDWLEQSHFEWVTVVQGDARLIFDTHEVFELQTGDCLSIPAHQKHKVTYTSSTPECIWIAVHVF